jgi:hypothetical protein
MNTSVATSRTLYGIIGVLVILGLGSMLYALSLYTITAMVIAGLFNLFLALICAFFTGYTYKNSINKEYTMDNFFVLGSFILLIGLFSGVSIGQILGHGIVGASAGAVLYFLLGNMAMRGIVNRFMLADQES